MPLAVAVRADHHGDGAGGVHPDGGRIVETGTCAELTNEVSRLQTAEGIEEAAREEIGYVQRGEIRLTVLPAPNAPVTMPGGWPYDTVAQIVAVRTANP